jgi:F0F1-type ATP synthase assembly protein I
MLEDHRVGKAAGPKNRQENQTPFLRRAGLYLGVAFELPGTILGGLLAGYYLDDYFSSSPWLLIICAALAFIAAFVRLLRWVDFFSRDRQQDGSHRQRNNPPY